MQNEYDWMIIMQFIPNRALIISPCFTHFFSLNANNIRSLQDFADFFHDCFGLKPLNLRHIFTKVVIEVVTFNLYGKMAVTFVKSVKISSLLE